MAKHTKNRPGRRNEWPGGATTLEDLIRSRARTLIGEIVEEELEAALGAAPSARVGETRQGYRHGTRDRTLTTSLGPTTFFMPRARLVTGDRTSAEWRSQLEAA